MAGGDSPVAGGSSASLGEAEDFGFQVVDLGFLHGEDFVLGGEAALEELIEGGGEGGDGAAEDADGGEYPSNRKADGFGE